MQLAIIYWSSLVTSKRVLNRHFEMQHLKQQCGLLSAHINTVDSSLSNSRPWLHIILFHTRTKHLNAHVFLFSRSLSKPYAWPCATSPMVTAKRTTQIQSDFEVHFSFLWRNPALRKFCKFKPGQNLCWYSILA